MFNYFNFQSIRALSSDFQNPLKTMYKAAHVFFTEGLLFSSSIFMNTFLDADYNVMHLLNILFIN